MKLGLFILIVLCRLDSAYSQIRLVGKITNTTNNEPLAFATVQLLEKSTGNTLKFSTTNSDGRYNIEINDTGNYNIKISHIAHIAFKEHIVLTDVLNEKNFSLKSNVNSLKEVVLDFKPKAMKIFNDSITYDLKQLTNGNEKTLTDIIEKLPGVKINTSGRIIVNGKMVKKLLIDGEELFKNQHQTTTESIGAKMVDGIRYLDKYNDFGNVKGFDNKQTNALDVAIKDEYKNRITGNTKIAVGYKSKYLANANLFKFGGNVKLGIIGDWNTLGKQSLTSFEYNELKNVSFEEIDKNGFAIDNLSDDTPKFLDPTIDVAKRENSFGAVSLIYKPNQSTKLTILHILSKTNQSQFFENRRQFFEVPELNFFEKKDIHSTLLLNSTSLNFGYQPNGKSFLEYIINFNPQKGKEKFQIDLTDSSNVSNINQELRNKQFIFDQKLSYLNRVTSKTLLKFTGLHIAERKTNDLDILSNNTILRALNGNSNFQINKTKKNSFAYQLQSVTNLKKNKFRLGQGIILSENRFINTVDENQIFTANFQSKRIDSYLNAVFDGEINKKLEISSSLAYRFVSLSRFENVFNKVFLQPSFSLLFKPKSSKTLNFEYKYGVDLPSNSLVNTNSLVKNYYTVQSASNVRNDQVLPDHQFNAYYSYYSSSSGSSFSTFINYSFAPKFISTNNTVGFNGTILFNDFTGENRRAVNYNLRFDKRFKSKLGVYSNFDYYHSTAQNSINNNLNLAQTTIAKNRLGVYSRFLKGVNFNFGLYVEFTKYKISQLNIKTLSSVKKPFINVDGSFRKKIITWNLGASYALYETDLSKELLLDIYPSITYNVKSNLKLILQGSNILNIQNAHISQNINAQNYVESSITDTLEGYITIGVSYDL